MEGDPPKESQSSQKNDENQESSQKNATNNPKKFDKKFSLSPEYKFMNQKFFPSKENFFGTKTLEKTNLRSFSPPTHSPIMNYYSQSFQGEELNFYPLKKNDNDIRKLSSNLLYNPSDYFNIGNSYEKNEDNKTLQEKMEPFVKKRDSNNFVEKNAFPLYNMNQNNEIKKEINFDVEDDEDEENNEQTFSLTINNVQPNNILSHNQNMNNNKYDINKDIKDSIDSSSISKDSLSEKNQIKNIINTEFKPYIPSRFKFNLGNYPNDASLNNKYNIYSENNNNYINFYQNNSDYNYIDFSNNNMNTDPQNQNNNFFYKGDNYQINNIKNYKKTDYQKTGEIPSITPEDTVIAITSNNKIIRRIDPNTYLNESIEFLAHNIFQLGQDQAGCRFLQEKIESDPEKIAPIFFKSMIPNLLYLIKDPFGNYLVQKLFPHLSSEDFGIILKEISDHILDIGSNTHGTRVLQNIIDYLSTPELLSLFSNIIKPHIISLLKEIHGMHIFNKLLSLYPEIENDIGKIIVDNCPLLAMHKHGCFFLQKILEGPDRPLKSELIKNLLDICLGLIIDQFGNYVIQSILKLNINKYSSIIALLISDNAPYYSKHRYSCNVIEKCFDFCAEKERNILIKKLCTPEVIPDLILDEHGNYVIQKALYYADDNKREEIFKIVKPLIPEIKKKAFGEKILSKLYFIYPKHFNMNNNKQNFRNKYKNNDYKTDNKNNNNNYKNKFNNKEYQNSTQQNKNDADNKNFINNNQNNNSSINSSKNKININNNTEKKDEEKINSNANNIKENNNTNDIKDKNNNKSPENKKKPKKKKSKKKKKSSDESSSSENDEKNKNGENK